MFTARYGLDHSIETRLIPTLGRAVSRRPLTVEARVPSQDSPCAVYHTQTVIWTGFSFSTSIFPSLSFQQRSVLIFIYRLLFTSRTNGRSLGTFRKVLLFRKSKAMDRKVLSYLLSLCLQRVKIWHLAASFVWRPQSNVQPVRRRNQVVAAAAVRATVRPTAGSFMWPRTDMTSQLTHLLQPCSTSPSTGHPWQKML